MFHTVCVFAGVSECSWYSSVSLDRLNESISLANEESHESEHL